MSVGPRFGSATAGASAFPSATWERGACGPAKRRLALILGLLLSAAQGEPLVQVAGVEGRASEPPALHLLAGQAATLRLQITSPAPGRVRFQADLYQLASGVAAPLAKDLPVGEVVPLEGYPIPVQNFILTPPPVDATTTMELRFAGKAEGAEKWQPAGSVRFTVHPADLLAQIKKQLATAVSDAGVKLAVVGESAALKAALRALELEFTETEAVAETEAATLFLAESIGEPARTLLEQTPAAARLVLFTREPTLPAGVYWTERAGGFVGKVTLPVLADFARAPERQLLFLNLFQQALRTLAKSP